MRYHGAAHLSRRRLSWVHSARSVRRIHHLIGHRTHVARRHARWNSHLIHRTALERSGKYWSILFDYWLKESSWDKPWKASGCDPRQFFYPKIKYPKSVQNTSPAKQHSDIRDIISCTCPCDLALLNSQNVKY